MKLFKVKPRNYEKHFGSISSLIFKPFYNSVIRNFHIKFFFLIFHIFCKVCNNPSRYKQYIKKTTS